MIDMHSRLRKAWVILGVLAALSAVFVCGAYAGRWAVKNQAGPKAREAIWDLLKGKGRVTTNADAASELQTRTTNLVRLEILATPLANSEGWGGGLQPLPDGRVFYATRTGEFGVFGLDHIGRALPFTVDLNLAELEKHPISRVENFKPVWFRVTDIDMVPLGGGRFDLLVGHHFFDAGKACVQLRLSHAVLREVGAVWELEKPFEVVMAATPCITFYHPGYDFAFEGHFSGGRIARMRDGKVLFTTGDHGWRGLRGYPAVATDDNSTLGKILLINVAKKSVEVFAKGVRNPQGLHIDDQGRIWETEHGPRGGDELNLITAGGDYGWPFSTYGTDYGPRPWPHNTVQGRHDRGTKPRYSWVPSIGVSNLIAVRGNEFPLWKGDLLVVSLTGETIHRLRLEDDRVVYDEPIRIDGHRLRDIAELPDGRVAVLSDHGVIFILRNADRTGGAPFLDAAKRQRLNSEMTESERAFAVAGRYASGAAGTGAGVEQRMAAADDAGARAFQRHCGSCHSLTEGGVGVGPNLAHIVGRQVGSTDFAYSDALAKRAEAWTAQRIVEFASDPKSVYPGSTMPPVALNDGQRADLVRYLSSSSR